MKRITYVGPDSNGVRLAPSVGRNLFFPQGEAVEVSNELAETLLAQDVFNEAIKPKSATNDGDE
jgi:hypothetical protein